MLRKLVAEALGTGILMAAVTGSTIMGSHLTADAGLGLLATSLTAGAALFVAISLFTPVSGGHLNPAVTLMAALRRDIGLREAVYYGAAQLVGAIAGIAAAHLMFGQAALQLSSLPHDLPSLWLSEVIATAGLILVILGGLHAKGPVPALVGTYITAGYWFTASTSFANPAMTIARAFTQSAAGLRPADVPAYLIAEFIGAALGYALGKWLFSQRKTPGLTDGG